MITLDGFYQQVKPISFEVALSAYIQEDSVSFLCGPFCNSACPIRTEITQFTDALTVVQRWMLYLLPFQQCL